MNKLFLLLFIVLNQQVSFSQEGFFVKDDSLNKTRLISVSATVGSAWTGSMIGLNELWYKDVPKTKWHTFDDSRNWLQMDKAGHFYTAYKLNQLTTDLFHWTGLKRRTSLWVGTGVSLGYQTTLEMLDAYSAEWGFSWSDAGANALGTGLFLGQDLLWEEERIIPKFSYHPTDFAAIRPEVLGNGGMESVLKDYNGQTYWLSFTPATFIKDTKLPKWLCFSVGYSAHEKLVGSESSYTDLNSGRTYNERREWLLSLDIDFSKLNIQRPWLRTIVKQLNYLKVPFPALILSDGKLTGHPFYF